MLNISIFGENSYIGSSFEKYADSLEIKKFNISRISSRLAIYKPDDFSQADSVLFCAGIAHGKAEEALYFSVNSDLAVSIATTAKQAGVRQFVYLSSAAVFGKASNIITPSTPPHPDSAYGKSKLLAENELRKLSCENFTVTIIRPPMVYGYDCKGNFGKLIKLTSVLPVFPDIENKRSMIYIENLCYFLAWVIENQMEGTFFPQNAAPVRTSELVKQIAGCLNKKIVFTRLFNPIMPFFSWLPACNKLFGSFEYRGEAFEQVDLIGFEEGVARSVCGYGKS